MTQQRQFKTKQVLTLAKMFRKWSEYSTGDILIGEVVGTHKDQYDKENLIVKVLDAQFKKDSAKFQGKNLVLNNVGFLNKHVEDGSIGLGSVIQITYNGTSTIEKGKFKGKEAHTGMVEILEEVAADTEEYDV